MNTPLDQPIESKMNQPGFTSGPPDPLKPKPASLQSPNPLEPVSCSRRTASEGTLRQHVLRKAEQYVSRDRNAVHGNPEDNFAIIAKLQYVYQQACAEVRGNATKLPHDVAVDNILQKIARLIQSPYHEDHWIDIAGYAACGRECAPSTPPQRNQPENL